MVQQPRPIAFWCHCCGEQVVEDHVLGWSSLYCTPCSLKAEPDAQEQERARFLS